MNNRLLLKSYYKSRLFRISPLRLCQVRQFCVQKPKYFNQSVSDVNIHNQEANSKPDENIEPSTEEQQRLEMEVEKERKREEYLESQMSEEELFKKRMHYGDGKKLGHLTAADDVPDAPPAGRALLRDMIIVTALIAALAYWRMKQREKVEKYPREVGSHLGLAKAHVQHAEEARSMEMKQYHLSEAENSCNKALRLLTSSLPDQNIDKIDSEIILDDAGVVAIHKEIGKLCYLQGKYKISAEHYLIVLKALSKSFGFHCDELLEPCRHISECYVHLQQYKLAEHFLDRAMKIASSDDQIIAQLSEQYAILYRMQGEWQKSIDKSDQSLRIIKKLFGPTHVQVSNVLLGQVHSYIELDELNEGLERATEALRVLDMQNLPSFQTKCTCLFLIGKIFLLQGNREQAVLYLKDALQLAAELKDKTREVSIYRVLKEAGEVGPRQPTQRSPM